MGDLVPRAQRYGVVRQLKAKLAEIAKRSAESFEDVSSAVEKLIDEMDEKHSTRPQGRPRAGGNDADANEEEGAGVLNPTKPKKGKGRTETKRKPGATGK